jgi:stage II sporulation protein AB (anti-sigma F factor)
VTNAIVHGCTDEEEQVELECTQEKNRITVVVKDRGVGIADIEQAMQPFYTSKPQQERTGMGFAFMEAFMDEVHVESAPGAGTTVTMVKYIVGADAR